MIARNCNECQTEYKAEQRYLNRGQGLFCSQRCAQAYHGRKRRVKHEPNTMCAWCGLDFYRKESSKKSKSGYYYCSARHQNLGATNNNIHRNGPEPRTERKTFYGMPCLFCKEDLPNKTQSSTQLHQKCLNALRGAYVVNAWLSGDNSVTLNRSQATGQPTDTKRFVKKHLLETRGDQCEQCGFNQHGPNGSIIQLDHINGNCFDNRPENLKLLCPNCHAMTPTYGSRNKGSGRAHRRK